MIKLLGVVCTFDNLLPTSSCQLSQLIHDTTIILSSWLTILDYHTLPNEAANYSLQVVLNVYNAGGTSLNIMRCMFLLGRVRTETASGLFALD
jgi:hypothetical protein